MIGAVCHLIDFRKIADLWAVDQTSVWAALLATAGVLVFGVLEGVLITVGFSPVALIYRATRPRASVLGMVEERYHDLDRRPDAETEPGVLAIRFDYELYFANASFFREEVRRLVREAVPKPYAVVLDCERSRYSCGQSIGARRFWAAVPSSLNDCSRFFCTSSIDWLVPTSSNAVSAVDFRES